MIKLKNILNEIVTEVRRRHQGSGTLEWEVEIDGLHIPPICLPTDTLAISMIIDYNYTPGVPERGMFGPPENASQAEDSEVEILGHQVVQILCKSPNGAEREIYYQYLIPQQQELIDQAIDAQGLDREDNIDQAIRNQEGED